MRRIRARRNIKRGPAGPKPVARAADRFDQPVTAPFVDLPTQAADIDLDDIRLRREIGIPQGADQPIASEDLAGMTCEELEQRELPRRQADLSSGPPNPQRCRIELEIADLDPRRTVLEPMLAQCPDARPELGHAEWLREIVIGPLIQARDAIVDVVQGGEDQDRAAETRTAEGTTDGEAIQSREG